MLRVGQGLRQQPELGPRKPESTVKESAETGTPESESAVRVGVRVGIVNVLWNVIRVKVQQPESAERGTPQVKVLQILHFFHH